MSEKCLDSGDHYKQNYEDIFSEEEIKNVFGQDKMFKDAQGSVKKGMIGFGMMWLIFIAVTFFIIEDLSAAPILLR